MGLPLFAIGFSGYRLAQAYRATGVIGLGDWAEALLRIVPHMIVSERRKNESMLQAMIGEAKANAPRDTGRLVNGIGGTIEDDSVILWAHAVREEGDEDYARFVEFGTKPSGLADASFFEGDGAHAIHPHHGAGHHGATPAEPFFYPAVRDQLEKRGIDADDTIAQAARAEGFDYG